MCSAVDPFNPVSGMVLEKLLNMRTFSKVVRGAEARDDSPGPSTISPVSLGEA